VTADLHPAVEGVAVGDLLRLVGAAGGAIAGIGTLAGAKLLLLLFCLGHALLVGNALVELVELGHGGVVLGFQLLGTRLVGGGLDLVEACAGSSDQRAALLRKFGQGGHGVESFPMGIAARRRRLARIGLWLMPR